LLSAREFGAEVVAGEWKTGANANAENKEIQACFGGLDFVGLPTQEDKKATLPKACLLLKEFRDRRQAQKAAKANSKVPKPKKARYVFGAGGEGAQGEGHDDDDVDARASELALDDEDGSS